MKMKTLIAALSGAILLSAATLTQAATETTTTPKDTTKSPAATVKDSTGDAAARAKGVASRGTSEVASATGMDRAAYTKEREAIEANLKAAKKQCDPLKGNEQDKCKAEAKYNEQVAKADLETKYKGTADAAYDAAVKKAKAKHDWDKQKCHDLKGAEQSACKKQAKADEKKAIADAKAARSSDKKVAAAPANTAPATTGASSNSPAKSSMPPTSTAPNATSPTPTTSGATSTSPNRTTPPDKAPGK